MTSGNLTVVGRDRDARPCAPRGAAWEGSGRALRYRFRPDEVQLKVSRRCPAGLRTAAQALITVEVATSGRVGVARLLRLLVGSELRAGTQRYSVGHESDT